MAIARLHGDEATVDLLDGEWGDKVEEAITKGPSGIDVLRHFIPMLQSLIPISKNQKNLPYIASFWFSMILSKVYMSIIRDTVHLPESPEKYQQKILYQPYLHVKRLVYKLENEKQACKR